MSKIMVRENDYGYAGNYYKELPKMEKFIQARAKKIEKYFPVQVTDKDRKVLNEALIAKGIKKTFLADTLHLSVGAVSHMLNGYGVSSFGKAGLEKVAKFLGVEDKISCLN